MNVITCSELDVNREEAQLMYVNVYEWLSVIGRNDGAWIVKYEQLISVSKCKTPPQRDLDIGRW